MLQFGILENNKVKKFIKTISAFLVRNVESGEMPGESVTVILLRTKGKADTREMVV